MLYHHGLCQQPLERKPHQKAELICWIDDNVNIAWSLHQYSSLSTHRILPSFFIVGKLTASIMNSALALWQHVHASPCRTEALAKVSAEMFFQFSFSCSANLSSMQHCRECSCTHWFTDWNSLGFTCSNDGVFVEAEEVVCNAIGGFKGAIMFWTSNLDCGVEPFFWIGEGMITWCCGNLDIDYVLVGYTSKIKFILGT